MFFLPTRFLAGNFSFGHGYLKTMRLISLKRNSDFPDELCVQIQTKTAIYQFDPNGLIEEALAGLPHLTEPVAKSDLSGEPAFSYRTRDGFGDPIYLRLSREELYRLIGCGLRPTEYQKIVDVHGVFHEVHRDFYYEDGSARQPKGHLILMSLGLAEV